MPMCPEDIRSMKGQLRPEESDPFDFVFSDVLPRISVHHFLQRVAAYANRKQLSGNPNGDGVDGGLEKESTTSDDEMHSALDYSDHGDDDKDNDDDTQSVVRCSNCSFEISHSVVRSHVPAELFNSVHLVCPVCRENLEVKTMKKHSSTTQENSLLSPFICDSSAEDSIKNASGVSHARSLWNHAPLVGDEKDPEKDDGKLRASFFQKLVLSTMF